MRSVILLFIDLVILLATTLKPGGVKSVIAENLLLKHQLIVLDRARRKAPNLKSSDRFLLGVLTLFMNCLLYTSPSPRDLSTSRMPSSA